MTGIQDRIAALVADAAPVRRLASPAPSAALWLAFALAVFALYVAAHGVDPVFAERAAAPDFLISILAALATGVLATLAAFQVSRPDRPLLWSMLPAPAAAIWVATIGVGCLAYWIDLPDDAAARQHAIDCFGAVSLVSLPLLLSLLLLLRHAFLLRPVAVALLASFAVAALGSAVLILIHPDGASLMVLGWNLGMVGLTVGLGRLLGPRVMGWLARA